MTSTIEPLEVEGPPPLLPAPRWNVGLLVAALCLLFVIVSVPNRSETILPEEQQLPATIPHCEESTVPSLELVRETKLDRLFHTSDKYEASDVTLFRDKLYVVCDSSWSLYQVDLDLQTGVEVHNDDNRPEDSDYEALFAYEDSLFAVREAVQETKHSYHAVVEQYDAVSMQRVESLPTELEFQDASKGLEGATSIRGSDGTLYVLGLCEGNHCRKSDDKGNGRLVVMKQGKHLWETVKKLHIPETAFFGDYSAVDVDGEGNVLVVSQEESRLWMGQLLGRSANGTWDVEQLALDASVSRVWEFPRSEACEVVYCNVEGVHWMGPRMIVAVSDRSKKKQPERCRTKDQSIHVFHVP